MQYQPSAAELLAAIAELLEDELLPALPDALQHKARVAANLARIIEREHELGPDGAARERERLAELLGHGGDGADLARELVERIRAGDDPEVERRAWPVLVASLRDDLAIAKPGHDAWEGT